MRYAARQQDRNSCNRRDKAPRSDRLERLERLAAVAAVEQRPAQRGPEEVVHRNPARIAERAADRGWLGRWGDAGLPEARRAVGRQAVRRPRDGGGERNGERTIEDGEGIDHGRADDLERRAGDEGREELHGDPIEPAANVADEPKIYDTS